jgi:hypothetical protein
MTRARERHGQPHDVAADRIEPHNLSAIANLSISAGQAVLSWQYLEWAERITMRTAILW